MWENTVLQTVAFVDTYGRQADLTFLPSGTRFLAERTSLKDLSDDVQILFLFTQDIETMREETLSFLSDHPEKMVCVVWNYQRFPYASRVVLDLAENFPYVYVKTRGETLHVTYSNCQIDMRSYWAGEELSARILQDLFDSQQTTVQVPNSLWSTLLWRYQYVLKKYDELSDVIKDFVQEQNFDSKNSSDNPFSTLSVIKKSVENAAFVSTEVSVLDTQNKELLEQLSLIQKKYETLSNSKPGKFILKFWSLRNKIKKWLKK